MSERHAIKVEIARASWVYAAGGGSRIFRKTHGGGQSIFRAMFSGLHFHAAMSKASWSQVPGD
jgi:hypothetical protein